LHSSKMVTGRNRRPTPSANASEHSSENPWCLELIAPIFSCYPLKREDLIRVKMGGCAEWQTREGAETEFVCFNQGKMGGCAVWQRGLVRLGVGVWCVSMWMWESVLTSWLGKTQRNPKITPKFLSQDEKKKQGPKLEKDGALMQGVTWRLRSGTDDMGEIAECGRANESPSRGHQRC